MTQVVAEVDREDAILNYTHGVRQQVVNHITNDGKKIPDDPKLMGALLTTLKDMDGSALGIKRIKSDDKKNAADSAAQQSLVAALLKTRAGMPTVLPGDTIDVEGKIISTKPIRELGSEVPPPDMVEGETSVGADPALASFETFTGSQPRG